MKKYSFIIFLIGVLTSCSGFLDEVDKDKLIPSETKHFAAVLLNEFSYEQAQFSGIDFMTDNIIEYGYYSENLRKTRKPIFTWQMEIELDENGKRIDNNGAWALMYEDIAVANYVMEMIDEAKGSQQERDFIKGEAYFVRAYSYFELVNLYGLPYNPSTAKVDLGVPLRTDNGIEQTYNRASVAESYELIIEDLTEAKRLLRESGIEKSVYHPSVSACDLLLSRVYLYMQNWQMAEHFASQVISVNSLTKMLSDIPYATSNCSDILYSSLITSGYSDEAVFDNGYRVNNELIDLYAEDDVRRSAFFQKISGRMGRVYYVTKRTNSFTQLGKNFLRVAEAYLNRAEARFHIGGDASADLQRLLESRYKNTASINLETGDALLNQILTERRKELCFEGHHRWFDLRRMEKRPIIIHDFTLTDSEGNIEGGERYTLFPDDLNYTLPIPLEERENNPLIRNNERYDKLPANF